MEGQKEDVVLPNLMVSESEINSNLYFNASNLKDGVKEQTEQTEHLISSEQPEHNYQYNYRNIIYDCTVIRNP